MWPPQTSVQAAENLIKRHEAFITTMDANDEKINAVITFATRLMEENHYATEKIQKKAEGINERSVVRDPGDPFSHHVVFCFFSINL